MTPRPTSSCRILFLLFFSAFLLPLVSSNHAEKKRFYLKDGNLLEKIKKNHKDNHPDIQNLLSVADQKLQDGPFSVIFKEQLPPSGDIHDYSSMGPYWWPDPEKEDGLPYIRRDGEVNPEYHEYKDKEQLGKLMASLSVLGEAYFFSEKEVYAKHAVKLIRAWFLEPETRMNPHLEYAQRIPGRTEGRGIGIIDTRRFSELPDIIGFISSSRHWTKSDQKGLDEWLTSYLDWLVNSKHGKDEAVHGNNHTTWYFAQTVPLALFTRNYDLADSLAKAGLPLILEEMFSSDGSQPKELARTKSWDYSAMNLAGIFTYALACEHLGMDLWTMKNEDGAGLQDGLDFLAAYLEGEKTWEYPQITDMDPEKLKLSLNIAAMKYQKEKYKFLAEEIYSGNASFDYLDVADSKMLVVDK